MTGDNDTLRRAAILIGTLDVDSADALLEHLPPAERARLRELMVELIDIDAGEEQQVIGQFLGRSENTSDSWLPAVGEEGVELCLSTESPTTECAEPLSHGGDATYEIVQESLPSRLNDIDGKALARLLALERPQTIAFVLSRLSKSRALAVLAEFSPDTHGEVLVRLAELDDADPAVITDIERELEPRLTATSGARGAGTHRAHAASIVAAASPSSRTAVAKAVAPVDQAKPAERLEFDDLMYLNDAGLASLLQVADPQITVLALAGATEAFVDRVARQLLPAEAKQLRRAIESLGPIRLADIESAQRQLARVAARLGARTDAHITSLPVEIDG